MSDNQVTVINLENGNEFSLFKGDVKFDKAISLIKEERFEEIEKLLDAKTIIQNFTKEGDKFKFSVVDGVGTMEVQNHKFTVNSVIVERFLKLSEEGFNCDPLIKFLGKLYNNPFKSSIDELYIFLDSNKMPITDDGDFIAYKVVRENYLDKHSGTIDNSVGQVVTMPRGAVENNREVTCSSGLHFCSKSYVKSFYSDGDRLMLVKINPADVVSIPSDYNNAKGRCCRYVVISEVNLDHENSSSVVKNNGSKKTSVESKEQPKNAFIRNGFTVWYFAADGSTKSFTYNREQLLWYNDETGKVVTRGDVLLASKIPVIDLLKIESFSS